MIEREKTLFGLSLLFPHDDNNKFIFGGNIGYMTTYKNLSPSCIVIMCLVVEEDRLVQFLSFTVECNLNWFLFLSCQTMSLALLQLLSMLLMDVLFDSFLMTFVFGWAMKKIIKWFNIQYNCMKSCQLTVRQR